jgi:hypothetical protein
MNDSAVALELADNVEQVNIRQAGDNIDAGFFNTIDDR